MKDLAASSECSGGLSECSGRLSECSGRLSECSGGSSECLSASSEGLGGSSECLGASPECSGGSSECFGASSECSGASAECLLASSECSGVSSAWSLVSSACLSGLVEKPEGRWGGLGAEAGDVGQEEAYSPPPFSLALCPSGTNMNLFLHYVGRPGASRDFPKTVFTDRPTSLVFERVPDTHPQKGYLLSRLGAAFPEGRWNCWGVPDGASPAIGALAEGDVFLLMISHADRGPIPALGVVEVYVPQRFPALSKALWGDRGFPYIFFFRTQSLDLTWPELRHKLGYNENYKGPIGQVQRINEDRVGEAGGPGALWSWLQNHMTATGPVEYSLEPTSGRVAEPSTEDGESAILREHDAILTASIQDVPELTDDAVPKEMVVRKTPRSEAFRRDIRKLYGGRCAICDLGVEGPKGEPEVQSAHIYPRSRNGKDDLRNGISLCRMHHWALDIGWISLTDKRRIIVRSGLPDHPDYAFIRDHESKPIREPSASHFAPHPLYMGAHRTLYGFH